MAFTWSYSIETANCKRKRPSQGPSLRVLPSGKAVASQATIRGFESHHPLLPLPQISPICGSFHK